MAIRQLETTFFCFKWSASVNSAGYLVSLLRSLLFLGLLCIGNERSNVEVPAAASSGSFHHG